MKTLYYISLVIASMLFASLTSKSAFAEKDTALTCTSVLPFICQQPDCSDNKKMAALCDGTLSFAEPGTECMKPRIPMAKCTRAIGAKPSVEEGDGPGIWYIAIVGGKPRVIKTAEEARMLFGTISDNETALGMTLILTNDFPLFAAPYPTLNNGWCTDKMDPGKWIDRYAAVTTVNKVDRGYQIRLFTISHSEGTDRLMAKSYLINDQGAFLERVTAKTPLWICPSKKKK